LKWNGWGFRDAGFMLRDDGVVVFKGARYELAGDDLPSLKPYMEQVAGLRVDNPTPSQVSYQANR
jgi:hypothetical protein